MEWRPRLKIYKDLSGKNTFNPETFAAHSYGHWQYVAKIKDKIVFNFYRYSHTTSKHQRNMLRFLTTEMKVKESEIIVIDQEESLDEGMILNNLYKKLFRAEFNANRTRVSKAYINEQKNILKEYKSDIKTLKKLGAKFYGSASSLATLRSNVFLEEVKRLEKNRIKAKMKREAQKNTVTEVKEQFDSLGTATS